MWLRSLLRLLLCVCHVNLRQFILDSHFAHINMHVNVIAFASLCLSFGVCSYFYTDACNFFLRCFGCCPTLFLEFHSSWHSSDELLCHLSFFMLLELLGGFFFFLRFMRPKTLIVFHFLLFAARQRIEATKTVLKREETRKSRRLLATKNSLLKTQFFLLFNSSNRFLPSSSDSSFFRASFSSYPLPS